MDLLILEKSGGCCFGVRVHPRARGNRLGGILDGDLVVHLAAPPVEGKANEALRNYLAETLSVRRSGVQIVLGDRNRRKVVTVAGIERKMLLARLFGNRGQAVVTPDRAAGL